jgi:hypothetical protein
MVKKNLPLIILSVVILIFISSLILAQALRGSFQGPVPSITPTPQASDNSGSNGFIGKIRNASLTLTSVSPKDTYKTGDQVTLDLTMDSGESHIIGVDAIIKYPEDLIKVDTIVPTTTFDLYPLQTAKNGEIKVSGLKNPETYVSGSQKIATITLEFLKQGQAALTFVYSPMSTVDSNVVEFGSAIDLLGKTNGLTLTIN